MEDLGQDINRVSSFSYYRCTNNSLKELLHYGKISDYGPELLNVSIRRIRLNSRILLNKINRRKFNL